jgi:hypothetical protein
MRDGVQAAEHRYFVSEEPRQVSPKSPRPPLGSKFSGNRDPITLAWRNVLAAEGSLRPLEASRGPIIASTARVPGKQRGQIQSAPGHCRAARPLCGSHRGRLMKGRPNMLTPWHLPISMLFAAILGQIACRLKAGCARGPLDSQSH